jgi:hypothetical protein
MWQMAGRCECDSPYTPPLLETNLKNKVIEDLLWLSRQVETILTAPTALPLVPIASNLLVALKKGGFAYQQGGLDSSAITEAILDTFDESSLRLASLNTWHGTTLTQSLRRSFTKVAIDGRRIPNVFRMLLLTRLVTSSVSSLWSPVEPDLPQKKKRFPSGYGRKPVNRHTLIDKEPIVLALKNAAGKISTAAKALGMSASVLAKHMRNHCIQHSLSTSAVKRLGINRINEVRDALAQGIQKNEISRRYMISEWSIILIELDRPELNDNHRKAVIDRQQEKHRNILLAFNAENKDEPGNTFAIRHAGSYDWLLKFDRNWFDAHSPEQKTRTHTETRKARKDWLQIDRSAVINIQKIAHQELTKLDRPKWLTRSRLLSASGAITAISQSNHYLKARAEAERLAENKEQFMLRAIHWALKRYALLHIPISTNKFRRVARLPANKLMKYRDHIIRIATELEIPFDSRCALAPWRL